MTGYAMPLQRTESRCEVAVASVGVGPGGKFAHVMLTFARR